MANKTIPKAGRDINLGCLESRLEKQEATVEECSPQRERGGAGMGGLPPPALARHQANLHSFQREGGSARSSADLTKMNTGMQNEATSKE